MEESGKVKQIEKRLLEADSEEELARTEEELFSEGFNPKTVKTVTSELRGKGWLKFQGKVVEGKVVLPAKIDDRHQQVE